MRIYKPTYRGRDGQVRESAKFYCELRTADGRVLRLPGFTNQRMTESLGRNVERLIECRASGDTLPQDTTRWIETLPIQTTKVLGRWGLLQGHTLAAGKALTEHLTDWLSYMRAKSLTERHATTMHHHALRIFTACKAKFLSDIRPAKVQVAIAAGKDAGLSLQTCNHLAMAVKAFTHWACRDGRLQTDPLAHLTKYNAALDKRHSRRALSPTEAQAIIQAAESGPTILGMDGHGRAVLYHTAYGTGFRANELRSLTPENFNLDGEPPTITVRAGFSKHRREDIQPIRHDLADMLRKYLAGKPAGTPVFDMPEKTYKLMRADCGAAGVAYCDDAGQYADFHAWRHSFISALAKANVSVNGIYSTYIILGLAGCPGGLAWSAAAALRYVPSEVVPLKWSDINWEERKIRITSTKNERHHGRGSRIIPLFPELEGPLTECFELRQPGDEFVITRYQDKSVNLRTQLKHIAGHVSVRGRAKCQPMRRIITDK